MRNVSGITICKWSIAALFVSQAYLAGGCEDPDAEGGEDEVQLREWTGYTSEENPPLTCADQYQVRGLDCNGSYCDDIALYCSFTGRPSGDPTWLPFFSEEGDGATDEGHCYDNDMWMTGIACNGSYCDNIGMLCSRVWGSSTGGCAWSDWYSEEQAPFVAPWGYYVKGIECDGSYCDNKRYHYCWMI